jgi:hypothetical protein
LVPSQREGELAVGVVMAAMDDEVEAVVAIVGYATPEVVLWYPGNVIVPVAWIWKRNPSLSDT